MSLLKLYDDSQVEILDTWFLCVILYTFLQKFCGFEHEFVTNVLELKLHIMSVVS